ncbi:MAG: HAD family hydrolase [Candidatus Asgardarchaeia archaeon]
MYGKSTKLIRGILVDLDDTLCNYREVSENAKKVLLNYINKKYLENSWDLLELLDVWKDVSHSIWLDVLHGRVSESYFQEARIRGLLTRINLNLSQIDVSSLVEMYKSLILKKISLFPDVEDLLPSLSRYFILGVLPNGSIRFQQAKIKKLKLSNFFDYVFISEDIGYRKPNTVAFSYAVSLMKLPRSQVIFIGDSPHYDIVGAKQAHLLAVWLNRYNSDYPSDLPPPDYTIQNFWDLQEIL